MTERMTEMASLRLLTPERSLNDYRLAFRSRQMSLVARREVLSGRAKFGGFGDGKEVPLLALAQVFRPGDFRSGYYRDQTLMLALGELTPQEFFAQLYADADPVREPHSSGRQMPAHFATHLLDEQGEWRDLVDLHNSAADMSPTAAQMPRLVGLAQASVLYRIVKELHELEKFSHNGREIAFGIIGNASCAQGMFWEAVNAIGVLQAPAIITILDDEYGISVPNSIQFAKPNLSELLDGFRRTSGNSKGYEIHTVQGWDYPGLLQTFHQAASLARTEHRPSIVHVTELTQPQGHSTSGSHERYKTHQRLAWEQEHDCLARLRTHLGQNELVDEQALTTIEEEETAFVKAQMSAAWNDYSAGLAAETSQCRDLLLNLAASSFPNPETGQQIETLAHRLEGSGVKRRRPIMEISFQALKLSRGNQSSERTAVSDWRQQIAAKAQQLYGSHLHSTTTPADTSRSPLAVKEVQPTYSATANELQGFEILNSYFQGLFERNPRVVTFGEDVGKLGGVNQTMVGLQERFGELRVADTGIRETTIVGQAIGLALRGLRPIAEIQYLDYVLYALQILSDDVASLHWRTGGRQRAPIIVRTRGHRLEGVWHSGSPMAGILNLVRGMHVVVPRDMTRAAGFYNTLLAGQDPGLVVEVLNGYRKKEDAPTNLQEFTLPLGVPEILRPGSDITLVTYGALCSISLDAAAELAEAGIDVEVIDVQTLLPFDIDGVIGRSVEKTGRLVLVDEDVPGGCSAYMLQQVLEVQGGYQWLDSAPRTLSSQPHRPAYGTDGGYFSKPQLENIFELVYDLMREANPTIYPSF